MKKWEYNLQDISGSFNISAEAIARSLDTLGEQGWELTCIWGHENSIYKYAIFKREKTS